MLSSRHHGNGCRAQSSNAAPGSSWEGTGLCLIVTHRESTARLRSPVGTWRLAARFTKVYLSPAHLGGMLLHFSVKGARRQWSLLSLIRNVLSDSPVHIMELHSAGSQLFLRPT